MSHFQETPPTILIDWASTPGAWPETSQLPWDNDAHEVGEGPVIVASPSISGNGALCCTINDAGATQSIRVRSSNEYPSFGYAAQARVFGLWLKTEKATGVETGTEVIHVYMLNSTNGSTAGGTHFHQITFTSNHLTHGYTESGIEGWCYLKWTMEDPDYLAGGTSDPLNGNKPTPWYRWLQQGDGFDDTVNLNSMQITMGGFANGDKIYFDRFEADHKATPMMIIGWDGNSTDMETIGKAKLDEKGWKGYFVVTEANTDTSLETDRGDVWFAAGWDAVNHTRTHLNLKTATQDDPTFEGEIGWVATQTESLGWLDPNGINVFAYPENETSAEAKRRIARLYGPGDPYELRLARGVTGRWCHFHPLCGVNLVPDRYQIGCYNMGNGNTLNQIKATMDMAVRLGTCLWLYGHIWETGSPPNDPNTAPANPLAIFTDHFNDAMDYAETIGLRVLPPNEAIQIAEFGEFGPLRRPLINAIDGDLNTATTWDSVKAQIPVSAVQRVSDNEATIALDALDGVIDIDADETLNFPSPIPSAWTQEDLGPVPVSGAVVIAAIAGFSITLEDLLTSSTLSPVTLSAETPIALDALQTNANLEQITLSTDTPLSLDALQTNQSLEVVALSADSPIVFDALTVSTSLVEVTLVTGDVVTLENLAVAVGADQVVLVSGQPFPLNDLNVSNQTQPIALVGATPLALDNLQVVTALEQTTLVIGDVGLSLDPVTVANAMTASTIIGQTPITLEDLQIAVTLGSTSVIDLDTSARAIAVRLVFVQGSERVIYVQ